MIRSTYVSVIPGHHSASISHDLQRLTMFILADLQIFSSYPLAFAITTYKAQELLMNKTVVVLQASLEALQLEKADNVATLRSFDMKVLQIRPSPAQDAKLKRLDELNIKASQCFDAGFTNRGNATHYSLTECAMLRTAAAFLQSSFGSTGLSHIANAVGLCSNTETIYNAILTETRRLRLNSALPSVIQSVCLSNILVDVQEFDSPASHFHNEKFDEGSLLVSNRLADVRANLLGEEISLTNARRSFGQALHTIQDFYSHSNWIELGRTQPNRAIGTDQPLGNYSTLSMTTCSNCTSLSCAANNILPAVISNQYLTSGYFSYSRTSPFKPIGKCSHGGLLDTTTGIEAIGYGINKNNPQSDHQSYHILAAEVALMDTIERFVNLQLLIGNETFARFLGFGSSSLVISIDTTGSMSPYIEVVKQVAVGIVEATRGPDAQYTPTNYILSPFNDPTWGPLFITRDPQQLINKINNLTAYGGGDLPELYYHGLNDALQVCEVDSLIYTFTDAPAKDAQMRPQVLARAIQLNTRIFSFYVGGSSIIGRRRRRRRDVYEELNNGTDVATVSGGLTVGLSFGLIDTNATKTFVTRRLYPQQSILTVTVTRSMNVTFIVDSNVTHLQIDLTSRIGFTSLVSNSLRLIDPNGLSVTPNASTSSIYFHLFTVLNPISGRWTLITNEINAHTIDVSTRKSLNETLPMRCHTTLSEQINDASNTSFAPFMAIPTVNQSNLVLVTKCTNLVASIQSVTIQLVNGLGQTIFVKNTTTIVDTGLAVTPIVIPNEDFRILTLISLTDGSIFQRQTNNLITPTAISISVINGPYTLYNTTVTNVTFRITNRARETLQIQLCVIDTLYLFNANGTCWNYTVMNQSSIEDIVSLRGNLALQRSNLTSGSITFSIGATTIARINVNNYVSVPVFLSRRTLVVTSTSTMMTTTHTESSSTPLKSSSTLLKSSSIILLLFVNVIGVYFGSVTS